MKNILRILYPVLVLLVFGWVGIHHTPGGNERRIHEW